MIHPYSGKGLFLYTRWKVTLKPNDGDVLGDLCEIQSALRDWAAQKGDDKSSVDTINLTKVSVTASGDAHWETEKIRKDKVPALK